MSDTLGSCSICLAAEVVGCMEWGYGKREFGDRLNSIQTTGTNHDFHACVLPRSFCCLTTTCAWGMIADIRST
jgi:hypothetical protein